MQQENDAKHTRNFKAECLTQESKVFERPGQSPDLNLMLQWEQEEWISLILPNDGQCWPFNLFIFSSNGSGETAVLRQVEQVQLIR